MASRRCIACGRILSDPSSVQRGYGPECYARIRRATTVTRDDHTTVTYVDQPLAARSRKALQTVVARALHRFRADGDPVRCSCGTPLTAGFLDLHDHLGHGGIRMPGYGADLWPTLRCDRCGYELAVWKIGVTQEKIDTELDRQRNYKGPKQGSTLGSLILREGRR